MLGEGERTRGRVELDMSDPSYHIDGRRIWVRLAPSDTQNRNRIKSLGAHWDPDSRQWWIGSGKRAEIAAILGEPQQTPAGETPAQAESGEQEARVGQVEALLVDAARNDRVVFFKHPAFDDWRIGGKPYEDGDHVVVTLRSGKTKTVVAQLPIIETIDGTTIAYGPYMPAPAKRPPARTSTVQPRRQEPENLAHGAELGHGGICDECGQPRRNLRRAIDSSGIGGQVCPRCFGPSATLSFS